jgi:LemA protein
MTLFSYLLIVSCLLILFFMYMWSTYNSFVRQINRVKNEYSNIDIQIKRRSSLLQNLADMVKAYAKHEQSTFENVAKARSAVEESSNANDYARAQTLIDETVRSLYVVVENYPELKANENFQSLQKELTRTEDIVAVYREEYNKAVLQYNTLIQIFPNVIIATVFNFKSSEYFEASKVQDNKVTI